MKTLLITFLLFPIFVQAQEIDSIIPIINNTDSAHTTLIITGDAFRSVDLPLFYDKAYDVVDKFYETVPIHENMDKVNIYIVGIISQNHGAGTWGEMPNTAFGSVFNYLGNSERLVRPLYDSAIVEMIDILQIPVNQILMIVNDGRYGGSGDFIGVPGTNGVKLSTTTLDTIWNSMLDIAIHELGHSWFGLSDAYVDLNFPDSMANDPLYDGPNVSLDSASIEWSYALGWPGVGIYSGALYRADRYRSSLSCTMRELGQPFCTWCSFIIRYKMSHVFPIVDPVGIEEIVISQTNYRDTILDLFHHYNILGQEISKPYRDGERNIQIRKSLPTQDSKKEVRKEYNFNHLSKSDYVKTCYDRGGNEVKNLFQAKTLHMNSGKIISRIQLPFCSERNN